MEPLQPLTEPAAAAAPTADQLVQGQQQASGMYRLDPNYRPAAEQRPRPQVTQSGWLGNGQIRESRASGGDPLFAATMATPTFQVDQMLGNVRQQKEQIGKWMQESMDQFKGRAADPYQQAYQQYVTAEHDKFFDDVAKAYYGGNRSEAIRGVYQDPELNRQFASLNRSLGAIGDANKGGWDYYAKVQDRIDQGEAEVDPETASLLQEGLNGSWAFNNQGAAQNAAKFDRLNERLSMNKLFDDFYRQSVSNAGDKTVGQDWDVVTKKGRKFLVFNNQTSYDEFVDSFVDQAMKDAPYRDREEVRRFVEARVPREQVTKIDPLPLGSGGGPSSANRRPRVGSFQVTMDNAVGKGTAMTPEVISAPIVDKDNKPFSEVFTLRGRTGKKHTVIPDRFTVDGDGVIFVVGTNPNSIETEAANAERVALAKAKVMDLEARMNQAIKGNEADDVVVERTKARNDAIRDLARIEQQVSKVKQEEAVRLDSGNEEQFRLLLGDDQINAVKTTAEQYKNRGRTGSLRGQQPAKASAPVPESMKKDFSQAEWDSLDEETRKQLLQ